MSSTFGRDSSSLDYDSLILTLEYTLGRGSSLAQAYVNETTVHAGANDAAGTVKVDLRDELVRPNSTSQINLTYWDQQQLVRRELDRLLPGWWNLGRISMKVTTPRKIGRSVIGEVIIRNFCRPS